MERLTSELDIQQTGWFKQQSLELLATQLQTVPYPGYPNFTDRLWQDGNEQRYGPVVLPYGPWETSAGEVPPILEQLRFQQLGLRQDSYGRPLHPWFEAMLTHPGIGVVTGRGFYWKMGPNYTADPIIVRRDKEQPYVLLISRKDTGQWALPGGFVEPDEDGITAAAREASEEALLDVLVMDPAVSVSYRGPLADSRVTANAWPETTAVVFELSDAQATRLPTEPYLAGDDARLAQWVPLGSISNQLFGSHKLLIQMSVRP